MRRLLDKVAPVPVTRAVAAAIAAPLGATLVAVPLQRLGPFAAVSVYLLAVVLSAALGRWWSGLVAGILSFLGLNYFFTPPKHTLRVDKPDDIVALFVFLVTSAIVAALVSRVFAERARARRSEREALILNDVATRLLSREPLERVLHDLAASIVDDFALARCEIRAGSGGVDVEVSEGEGPLGQAVGIPLVAAGRDLGALTVVRGEGHPPLSRGEEEVLAGFARQTALALDRARLDAEVERAWFEADASQTRAALFSSVTHDLRTPLASMKAGVSGLLQEDAVYDDEQRRELLQTVLEETDRLDRLVGNILELARVRAGALEPQTEITPVEDIVEAVLARMSKRLQPFKVRTLMRPELPPVLVDPLQIDQVLTNILENAVRFSPAGGEILISASPWQRSVRIRIADQGPGVDPADRDRVFEEFQSSEDPRSGTGLGLAIARAIVDAHSGRIWVEGSPGGGAAIVIELPAEETR